MFKRLYNYIFGKTPKQEIPEQTETPTIPIPKADYYIIRIRITPRCYIEAGRQIMREQREALEREKANKLERSCS